MHSSAISNHRNSSIPSSRPKPGPIARWYLPAMALIGVGFGLWNHHFKSNRPAQIQAQMAEEERLKRNRQLMDAYGDKDNLKDIERALAVYEIQ